MATKRPFLSVIIRFHEKAVWPGLTGKNDLLIVKILQVRKNSILFWRHFSIILFCQPDFNGLHILYDKIFKAGNGLYPVGIKIRKAQRFFVKNLVVSTSASSFSFTPGALKVCRMTPPFSSKALANR